MRVAVINWSRRKVGGVENYLENLLPALIAAGHAVALWVEVDQPSDREIIKTPDGVASWRVDELGVGRALAALRDWGPDLIYSHGMLNPQLEAAVIETAPAIFFAHNYYGTCISGEKSFKRPIVRPCGERFGKRCLLRYYPNRCGGLSPATMLREYRIQDQRLKILPRYSAIVTHSEHMRSEYIQHGVDPGRIHRIAYLVEPHQAQATALMSPSSQCGLSASEHSTDATSVKATAQNKILGHRILFLSRMTLHKGGDVLLDALPKVTKALAAPLHLTFAGDGKERRGWERKARQIQSASPALTIDFVGWVDREAREALWKNCDLLVVPSLWPEPFGLVGPEAGSHGVPIAAFAVGGIGEWLIDGINGYLAPGDPPSADKLADAIIKCLQEPEAHARLSLGAISMAENNRLDRHMNDLTKVFNEAARSRHRSDV